MISLKVNKPVFSWAMYDFANSAFTTSLLSVIFNVYFATVLVPKEGVSFMGTTIPGESLWGYLISAVMLCVILIGPALGALADRKSSKRKFLIITAGAGMAATLFLFGAVPGRLWYAVFFSFVAILGYEMSLIFYNAFLTDIADESTAGRVSGFGFALGYIGGGLCLALNMVMIMKPEIFGLAGADTALPVRASILVVGIWWMVFSIPLILGTGSQGDTFGFRPSESMKGVPLRTGTISSLKDIWGRPDLKRFLISFIIYDDGIQTIILMAAIFGAKALGMNTVQLSLCYLMIQFVAFFGAIVCGRLADAWNHKNVVLGTLAIYCGVVVWGAFMKSQREFWILGIVVGLVLGGSQAASRSLFALLIPPARAGEFFAFFSIIGKAAALIGPFVFGIVSQFWGLRAAVGSMLVFFVAGGAILVTVNESRGRLNADAEA